MKQLFHKNYSRRALNVKGKTMNFEKLASNLNEEEKKLESQISSYCNPKEIAQELMSRLEKETPVGNNCEIGPGRFVESGALFVEYPSLWRGDEGPLGKCSNKSQLAQVVLNSVKKYITEDIIKLNLNEYVDPNHIYHIIV
jgi:hypothetical protein